MGGKRKSSKDAEAQATRKAIALPAPGSRAWWLQKAARAEQLGESDRAAACRVRAAEV